MTQEDNKNLESLKTELMERMKNKTSSLRKRAEEFLDKNPEAVKEIASGDVKKLIEDLHIHQIELEIQNEELRWTRLELEASRDRYSDLYDFAPVGYVAISEKGSVLQANLSCAAMLGVERSSLIGKPLSRFITKDDQDVFYLHRKSLFETEVKQVCELRLVRKDRTRFHAQLESIVVKDTKGDIAQTRTTITDINERKLAEEALQKAYDELDRQVKERTAELTESNEELNQLFQTVTDAIMLFDAQTRQFVKVNNAVLELYGYTKEEILRLRHQDITAEPEKSDASILQTLEGKPIRIPVRYHKKKDGTIFPVEISASSFMSRNRKVLCGVIRDITERKHAEDNLREREKIMKAILAASPVGICLTRNRILDWSNSAIYRILGYEEDSLLGKSSKMLYSDAEEYERVGRDFYSEIVEKGAGHFETRWVTKDGREIYCYLQGCPLDPSDLSKGIIVTVMDITERKRAEDLVRNLSQMLMQSQERERQMISHELHDNIAQNLSWIKIGCDTFFKGKSDVSYELIEKMKKLSKLTEQTITAVRDLSYDLRPPGIDEIDLFSAIEIYCKEFSEKSGLEIDLQLAGMHNLDLNDDTKIHLYRLIQEGLNNIRKHAEADRVAIKLVGASPTIILRIEDNGKGFDLRDRELSLNKEKRMGLRSMKERVNLLGGEMTIQSRLMKGTKIFIKFPFKEKK